MGMILKIAWRNIWRHKGKSLIIGTILFVAATILTVGMGTMSGMNRGMEKNIVENFTGDIVIASKKQKSDNVFFSMMGQSTEILPDYHKIKEFLDKNKLIKSFLPIGKNLSMVLNEEGGPMGSTFIIGIDINQYNAFFPDNLKLIQGSWLESFKKGVLLTPKSQILLAASMDMFFIPELCTPDTSIMPDEIKLPGDNIIIKQSMVFMGFNNNNTITDIRQPIRGLVKYNALNSIFGSFILMDIESYRYCLGYIAATNQTADIPNEHQELLEMDNYNPEDLFSESLPTTNNDNPIPQKSLFVNSHKKQKTTNLDLDDGTYNLVLLKLRDGIDKDEALKSITIELNNANLGVRPIIWHKAIGTIGNLALLMKSSLFVFVTLMFFVAIIIIINTLSMAALERTSEIGMMRAIGAHKSFVSWMFIAETMFLSFFFGSMGTTLGWLIVTILSALQLTSTNDMIQLLFGGDIFAPFLTINDFFIVIIQLIFVAFIAVLYPMSLARNIQPLEAISRE